MNWTVLVYRSTGWYVYKSGLCHKKANCLSLDLILQGRVVNVLQDDLVLDFLS